MELLFVSCFLLLLFSKIDGEEEPITAKLHKDLFANYEKDVLPIFEKGEEIKVYFGLHLQRLIKVDVHNEALVIDVRIVQHYTDKRLTWNSTSYNGVQRIRLNRENIWSPDIKLYNSLATVERTVESHVLVSNNGYLLDIVQAHLTASCAYDLKWFPFDTQKCSMTFGSWSYDGNQLNVTIQSNRFFKEEFAPNPGWELISTSAKRNVRHYKCCPNDPFIDMVFTLEVKRRGTKYAWEYVTPAVVLSFLVPVLFLLPSDNSARFSLGAGMMVTIMFLMDMLRYTLPEELIEKPMIGIYYDMMFFLVCLAMAMSAIICCLASKSTGSSPPPGLLKTVLLNGLGRICCVSFDRKYGAPTGSEMDSDNIIKSDNQTSEAAYEWRLIAKVLDRLLLFIFFIVIVIGSLAILPK